MTVNQPTEKETLLLRMGEVIRQSQPRCPAVACLLRAAPTTPL
jgi:hypothetical protein